MILLKYGNTNTFLIPGGGRYLLVDTDWAGTLPAFYRALKQGGVRIGDIAYVMATHWHPDHMGLIPELMRQGIGLLLPDVQRAYIHGSDGIFARDGIPFEPVREEAARVISCGDSRRFLREELGIGGEIVSTPCHSPDSVSLILDDGDCLVGDLEPLSWLEAYGEDEAARTRADWELLLSRRPKRILYGHANMQVL